MPFVYVSFTIVLKTLSKIPLLLTVASLLNCYDAEQATIFATTTTTFSFFFFFCLHYRHHLAWSVSLKSAKSYYKAPLRLKKKVPNTTSSEIIFNKSVKVSSILFHFSISFCVNLCAWYLRHWTRTCSTLWYLIPYAIQHFICNMMSSPCCYGICCQPLLSLCANVSAISSSSQI